MSCGDDRDRTGNLRLAKPALSQLSYVPGSPAPRPPVARGQTQVRVLGFEPRTSALSELRSSQLSYTRRGPRQTKKPNPQRFGSIRFRLWDRALPLLADVDDSNQEHALTLERCGIFLSPHYGIIEEGDGVSTAIRGQFSRDQDIAFLRGNTCKWLIALRLPLS